MIYKGEKTDTIINDYHIHYRGIKYFILHKAKCQRNISCQKKLVKRGEVNVEH